MKIRLAEMDMISRDLEIVQGMAVTGLTIEEAEQLVRELPAMIARAKRSPEQQRLHDLWEETEEREKRAAEKMMRKKRACDTCGEKHPFGELKGVPPAAFICRTCWTTYGHEERAKARRAAR